MVLVSDVIAIPDNSLENAAAVVGDKANTRSILHRLKLPVPKAFVVTSAAFYRFLNYQNGLNKWRAILDNAQVYSPENLVEISRSLQQLVKHHDFDPQLVEIIHEHYHRQLQNHWAHLTISPTPTTKAPVNIPLPIIKGETALIDFLRQIWSAQLSPHSLSLQLLDKSKLIEQTPILVSVHEKALVSGTITTIEPETGNKNAMMISAIYGTNPQTDHKHIPADIYIVDHTSKSIISRQLVPQQTAITADYFGHYHETKIPAKTQYLPKLNSDQIDFLITGAKKIHSELLSPQVINWLMTDTGIYFTRFHTFESALHSSKNHIASITSPKSNKSILAKGLIASPGITTGPIIRPSGSTASLNGKVVLLTHPDAHMLKRIRQASGIIIESAGVTSDIASVARDIGIPTLIGVGHLDITDGTVVNLDAIKGFVALDRTMPKPLKTTNHVSDVNIKITSEPVVATRIYLSVNQLSETNKNIYQQAAGVGELKGNDIVTALGIHPKRLIDRHSSSFKDALIKQLTTVANHFGDRPVYYHPVDFPTANAKALLHGSVYEPGTESNTFFGFRGAFRAMTDPAVFKFEMDVVSDLRHKHQLKNLSLCLPLVRSIEEYIKVKKYVSAANLYRSPSFKLGVKIGTPAAASFIPKLADEGVDFIFIDLDLLSLSVQGFDPDSSEVDQELNLINPVFISTLMSLIKAADSCRLPCLGFSYQLDQKAEAIDSIVNAGLSGICIHPPHYSQVYDWLKTAEVKLLTSR